MPFVIAKQGNLPAGLFRPPNALPPRVQAFVDWTGAPIVNQAAPGNLMALHHIVSKEKLKTFFDTAAAAGDMNTPEFKAICMAVIAKHYARKQHPTSDGYPSATAFQDVNGNAVSDTEVKRCLRAVLSGVYADRNAADQATNGVWQLFENFFFWWPGNLHHGPRSRLDPNSPRFEPDLDDGGEGFEEAAKRVVPETQFKLLKAVDTGIDDYVTAYRAYRDRKDQSKRCGYLEQILEKGWEKLLKVGPYYNEPTPFDRRRWKPQTINGTRYYRLKSWPTHLL